MSFAEVSVYSKIKIFLMRQPWALNMSDPTLRSRMKEWKKRGGAYKILIELVRWRKKMGTKGTVPLDESIFKGTAASVDFPDLLSDVVEELGEMNPNNWADKADDLAELLRPYVSRE